MWYNMYYSVCGITCTTVCGRTCITLCVVGHVLLCVWYSIVTLVCGVFSVYFVGGVPGICPVCGYKEGMQDLYGVLSVRYIRNVGYLIQSGGGV